MQNSIAIKCEKCGSPLSFNIIKQTYYCEACGTEHPTAQVTERVRSNSNRKYLISDLQKKTKSVYSCSNCGARVVVPEGELMQTCDFCGTSIAKSEFTGASFPDAIIPFYITKDEAIDIFKRWAKTKVDDSDIEALVYNVEDIDGYYLPYQMVRGNLEYEIDYTIEKSGGLDRDYVRSSLPGYLHGIYINQSGCLDNDLLELIEPFDNKELVDFEFSYLAGQRALLPDISEQEFHNRLTSELENAYRPNLEEALKCDSINIEIREQQDLIFNTVYLPVYVLWFNGNLLVINGQTGRIAVSDEMQTICSDRNFFVRKDLELLSDNRTIEEYQAVGPQYYRLKWDDILSYFENYSELFLLVLLCLLFLTFLTCSFVFGKTDIVPLLFFGIPSLFFLVPSFKALIQGWKEKNRNVALSVAKHYSDDEIVEVFKYSKIRNSDSKRVLLFFAIFVSVFVAGYFFIVSKMSETEANYETRRSANKIEPDSAVYIAFIAKNLDPETMQQKRASTHIEFKDIDGKIIRTKYNCSEYRTMPAYLLAYRRIDNEDLSESGWYATPEISLKQYMKDYYGKHFFLKVTNPSVLVSTGSISVKTPRKFHVILEPDYKIKEYFERYKQFKAQKK